MDSRPIGVTGATGGLGGRVADEQALRHAVVGEPPGDPCAEPPGRARHADGPAVHTGECYGGGGPDMISTL